MRREYGWGPRGQRVVGTRPCRNWKTVSIIGAIRLGEKPRLMTHRGAVSGRIYLRFVRHRLVPWLRRGDVVVMDNLNMHKMRTVKEGDRRSWRDGDLPSDVQPRAQPHRAALGRPQTRPPQARYQRGARTSSRRTATQNSRAQGEDCRLVPSFFRLRPNQLITVLAGVRRRNGVSNPGFLGPILHQQRSIRCLGRL